MEENLDADDCKDETLDSLTVKTCFCKGELCNGPNHCELSQWGDCDATCGKGIKRRNIVIPAKHGGNECSEELTQPCNLKPCPVDCQWSGWNSWSSCSRSCDRGSQSRSRSKLTVEAYGGTCSGSSYETKYCNTHNC